MATNERIHQLKQRAIELVAVPSSTGSEANAVEAVACGLAPVGDRCDRWDDSMSLLERDKAFPGWEVDREIVPVVAAKIVGERPGPRIVLTGHVDVVPIGDPDTWTRDPSGELDGDILYGRGACDMKAGLVAALEAFNEIAGGSRDFPGEVLFVAVSGEEDGGHGTLAAIRRGWTGDYVIIPEPTSGPSGPRIVTAHGGALTYTIGIEGKAAHAAKRTEGESAIDHFITVYRALRRIEAELNEAETNPAMKALGLPYPTTVGVINGGDWASNVMDHLTAEIRVGVAIDETIAQAEERFERTLREAIAGDPWLDEHPPTIERTGAAFGSSSIDPDHQLVTTLADAAESVSGKRPELGAAPYGCDMALWIREGGAAAVVYGPGDVAYAHAADEHVDLNEAVMVSEVLVETIRRLHADYDRRNK